MKLTNLLLTLALALFGAQLCFAQDPNMGTWKLNEAQSKLPASSVRVNTATYEAQGDQIKVTSEAVDANGSPMHLEWVGKFDGHDYPVVGDPNTDTRSYKRIDAHTLLLTTKKAGKTISTVKIELSPDGKTRTGYLTGTDPTGKPVTGTAVYDKQ